MLTLVLLLLLVWLVLVVFLTGWSMWIQNYLYTEPAEGLVWRGPAAGTAIMLVLFFWVILDYSSPGSWRTLFDATSSEDSKPFPELRIPSGKSESGEERYDVYKLRPGGNEYRRGGKMTGKPLPSRPEKIIVIEGEEKTTFEPERDESGHFKQHMRGSWFGSQQKEPLRYIDEKGRVMLEGSLGQIARFHSGMFLGNVLVNLLVLAVAFVACWLLLAFQWPHALGHAVGLWAVLVLFVLPPLLTRAEETSRQRAETRRLAE